VNVTGVDTDVLLTAFQRHPAAALWIHAGTAARADDGWTRRAYAGTDPGAGRLHLGIRPAEAAERDPRPWGLTQENGMDAKQLLALLNDPAVARQLRALPWQYIGGGIPRGMSTLGVLNELVVTVRAIGEVVAKQSADPAAVRALLPAQRADAEVMAAPTNGSGGAADLDALADAVAARVIAALPPDPAGLSRADLTAALRDALTGLPG
jgi:hypothetical protein